jgi:hypothetical protein
MCPRYDVHTICSWLGPLNAQQLAVRSELWDFSDVEFCTPLFYPYFGNSSETTWQVNPAVSLRMSAQTSLYWRGLPYCSPTPQTAQNAHTRQHVYLVSEIGSTRAERPLIVPWQHRGSKEIVHTGAKIRAPCLHSPRHDCYCSNQSFF